MYKGKELCQGCKKPGSETPRRYKQELCQSCENIFHKGSSIEILDSAKYARFGMMWYYFRNKKLDRLVRSFFKSMHNQFARKESISVEDLGRSAITASDLFIVPIEAYEAMTAFAFEMKDWIEEIEKRESDIEPSIKRRIQEERDIIYNAGIERGRNLLISLATQEVTIQDLSGKAESYKPTAN